MFPGKKALTNFLNRAARHAEEQAAKQYAKNAGAIFRAAELVEKHVAESAAGKAKISLEGIEKPAAGSTKAEAHITLRYTPASGEEQSLNFVVCPETSNVSVTSAKNGAATELASATSVNNALLIFAEWCGSAMEKECGAQPLGRAFDEFEESYNADGSMKRAPRTPGL
jgi:hypothetical protein